MKKFCLILLAIILGICLLVSMMFFGFLYSHQKSVISSLPDYESREFYTSGGFQDYTDYAKYFYDSITAQDLESSERFTVTTDENVEEILLHIDDFERAVAVTAEELKENYDFDRSIVTEGDSSVLKLNSENRLVKDSTKNFTIILFAILILMHRLCIISITTFDYATESYCHS